MTVYLTAYGSALFFCLKIEQFSKMFNDLRKFGAKKKKKRLTNTLLRSIITPVIIVMGFACAFCQRTSQYGFYCESPSLPKEP